MVVGPIGSRDDFLTVSWRPAYGMWLSTGCFSGSIDAFEKQARVIHGATRPGQDYAALLNFLTTLDKLQHLTLD